MVYIAYMAVYGEFSLSAFASQKYRENIPGLFGILYTARTEMVYIAYMAVYRSFLSSLLLRKSAEKTPLLL